MASYIRDPVNENTIYVFEAESVWVPGKGSRKRRKLIGRLDPVTGELSATGKPGRPRKKPPEPPAETQAEAAAWNDPWKRIEELEETVRSQREYISSLEHQLWRIRDSLSVLQQFLSWPGQQGEWRQGTEPEP